MGFIGSSTLPVVNSNSTRTVYNITLGTANTEQSQVLPADTKEYLIKSRGNAVLKLAFVATESGTNYITIPKNGVWVDSNFTNSLTVYFQSPQSGDTVEIVAWS